MQSKRKIPWILIGSTILRKGRINNEKEFKSFFKLSISMIDFVWKKLKSSNFANSPKYLLYTLYFLKTTNSRDFEIAQTLGIHVQTLKLHVTRTMEQLITILPGVCCIRIHLFY
jgi:hypothetical protein